MARQEQLGRLFKVAQMIAQSRRGLPVKHIAERCGVPLRTAYRDLEALESAHCPLEEVEPGSGRYRFLEGWQLFVPSQASIEELAALWAARAALRPLESTPIGRGLASAWSRLATRPGDQLSLWPGPDSSWVIRGPDTDHYAAFRGIVLSLHRAVRDRLVVESTYHSLYKDEVTQRALEPAELHYDPATETLYCLAWCRLREDIRIFAVHRFRAVSVGKRKFEARPGVRSQRALANAFRIYRSKFVHAVAVRLQGAPARLALERPRPRWHVERLGGGGARVRFEAEGLDEVARWVLAFGPDAVVEEPAALVDLVRTQHAESLLGYRTKPLPTHDNRAEQSVAQRPLMKRGQKKAQP